MKRFAVSLAGVLALASPAWAAPPRLVVVISIDQFGADLFNANRARFHEGLKTLADGVVYPNAFQAHGQTETCAGHAVILSGAHPRKTGIIANQWYDAASGKSVYCTDDGKDVAATTPRAAGVGPGLLETSTLGDWMKAANPRSRVVSVAGKDRSAIMMGGHAPDGAFWLSGKAFDTWGPDAATAKARLAPLAGFNAKVSAELAGKAAPWTYADPSCRRLEHSYVLEGGQTFTSRLPPAPPKAFPGLPVAAASPPLIDALTLRAATELIKVLDLGRGPAPDLLAIGLSGTDMVGHAFGSQGPEMCDQLARLDASLGRFLADLRKSAPEALVVVTADHGAADFPERLAERGYPSARRLDPRPFLTALNAAVRAEAGIDWAPLKGAGLDITQLYIVGRDGRPLQDIALRERLSATAIRILRSNRDVAGAWGGENLAGRQIDPAIEPPLLDLEDRMALSYFAGRSGDINLALDPMVTAAPALPSVFLQGHGAPYDVNRKVPLIFWWKGIAHEERTPPVDIVDLAPTLANLLGVPAGSGVDGRPLGHFRR